MSRSLGRRRPESGAAWTLQIRAGDQTWEHPLDEERIVVGRAEECTIVLDDERVSKRHFEIHREGEDFVLTDLGSRNGTRVNGQVLSDVILRPGDRIELGRTRLEVLAQAASGVPSEPGPEAGAGRPRRDEEPLLPETPPGVPEPRPDLRPAADAPRRVEVLLKSSVPYASTVEARHGEKPWKLPLYAGLTALLGLLALVLSTSQRPTGTEDNPLARIHSGEGAPEQDLLKQKSEQEARQLRESVLARAGAALEGLSLEAISQMREPEMLEAARGKLEEARDLLARLPQAGPPDEAARELAERTKIGLREVESRIVGLASRRAARIRAAVARAQGLVSSGRLDEADSALRELVALDPGNAEARRLASEINTRRAASAEEARRKMQLKKLGDDVEILYRSGLNAAELGNGAQALEFWTRAEEAFARLREVPRARGSAELRKAEKTVADIGRRKAALKPRADPLEQEAERLLGKARLYEELGQLDKARELWQNVLEVIPNPEHRYHKMALQKLGQAP
jgi:tetratricopeptide (TPR) repeat protein